MSQPPRHFGGEGLSRRRVLGFGAAGLGALLIGYALFGADSVEEQIRRVVMQFGQALTVDSGESPLVATARVNGAVADITTEDVRVTLPELPELGAGRRDLVRGVTQGRVFFRTAEVAFRDLKIKPSGAQATVSAEATLTGVDRHGRPRREVRAVTLELLRDDGWRVKRVVVAASE